MPKKQKRNAKPKIQRRKPATSPAQPPGLAAAQEKAMRQMEEMAQQRFTGAKVIRNTGDTEKMSDVLERFVEPYVDEITDDEAMDKLFAVAVIAWNAALLEPNEQADFIEKMAKALPWRARRDFRQVVLEMVERKNRFFADNQRHIFDYKFTDLGGQYHLSVISSFPPDLPNEKA